tara:strand:- start:242 stop:502 length:261 start_codon:yes stop_codon:yes gene_type:complete
VEKPITLVVADLAELFKPTAIMELLEAVETAWLVAADRLLEVIAVLAVVAVARQDTIIVVILVVAAVAEVAKVEHNMPVRIATKTE